MSDNVLEIESLTVQLPTDDGWVTPVKEVSLSVPKGKVVALVGESGSGKSVTALSMLQLHRNAHYQGKISFQSREGGILSLLDLSGKALRNVRGNQIGMVFQEPMTSLNPVFRVGYQLLEPIRLHQKKSEQEAKAFAISMLDVVGMHDPERCFWQYPHELSGGMRQRVMLAMALSSHPQLLIADEPTTALDVTIQAQILSLLGALTQQFEMSVLLITHDMGVVAEVADIMAVMYAGEIVEYGPVEQLFKTPQHPYTYGLLESMPRMDRRQSTDVLPTIPGAVPDIRQTFPGCHFASRCAHVRDVCQEKKPDLAAVDACHWSRCFYQDEIKERIL